MLSAFHWKISLLQYFWKCWSWSKRKSRARNQENCLWQAPHRLLPWIEWRIACCWRQAVNFAASAPSESSLTKTFKCLEQSLETTADHNALCSSPSSNPLPCGKDTNKAGIGQTGCGTFLRPIRGSCDGRRQQNLGQRLALHSLYGLK